jgi:hypothetical protein
MSIGKRNFPYQNINIKRAFLKVIWIWGFFKKIPSFEPEIFQLSIDFKLALLYNETVFKDDFFVFKRSFFKVFSDDRSVKKGERI